MSTVHPDSASSPDEHELPVPSVIPVAVIGSGAAARFQTECLQLDSRFQLVTPGDTATGAITDAEPRTGTAAGWHPGDSLPEVRGLFVLNETDPHHPDLRCRLIEQHARCGRHVFTESPIANDPATAASLASDVDSEESAARIHILRRSFEDPDFRRASQVVADGEAGTLLHVDFIRQQMAAAFLPDDPEAPAAYGDSFPAELQSGVLFACGPDLLAQTLTLIRGSVVRVFAALSYRRPEFGPLDAPPGRSRATDRPDALDTGFHIRLEFDGGETAQLCIDLAAHADLETGWVLQMTRGGYRQSRQVLSEADGEIYDVPVEPERVRLLDAAWQFLTGASNPSPASANDHLHDLFSLETELRVLSLLAAVRESAAQQTSLSCQI